MYGEFSPQEEDRRFTKIEALLDLTERASTRPDRTIAVSYRSLSKKWGWKYHHKVMRFIKRCIELGYIGIPSNAPSTRQRTTHLTIVPPTGFEAWNPSQYPIDNPPTPQPHYIREREKEDRGFEEEDKSGNDSGLEGSCEIGEPASVADLLKLRDRSQGTASRPTSDLPDRGDCETD